MKRMTTFFLIGWCVISCAEDLPAECRGSFECPQQDVCLRGVCQPSTRADEPETPSYDGELPDHRDLGLDAWTTGPAFVTCDGRTPRAGDLVINEVLANVPPGEAGDANRDGVRHAHDDEFIELVNVSEETLSLDGVAIYAGDRLRYRFEDFCLRSFDGVVVFGGGSSNLARDVNVLISDSRFALPNDGGRVELRLGHQILTRVDYGRSPPVSLQLWPELTGTTYVHHPDVAHGILFSPGTCANGQPFSTRCETAAEPEADLDMGTVEYEDSS